MASSFRSFKSSGTTQATRTERALTKAPIPIGIKTPLSLSDKDGLLSMHYSLVEQMIDNLRNLLLTNHGDRLMLYDFGANLRPLCSEFTTQEDFDSQAIERIRTAVSKWMPYISLDSFESTIDRFDVKNTGKVRLKITFDIPALKATNLVVEVMLYVM